MLWPVLVGHVWPKHSSLIDSCKNVRPDHRCQDSRQCFCATLLGHNLASARPLTKKTHCIIYLYTSEKVSEHEGRVCWIGGAQVSDTKFTTYSGFRVDGTIPKLGCSYGPPSKIHLGVPV